MLDDVTASVFAARPITDEDEILYWGLAQAGQARPAGGLPQAGIGGEELVPPVICMEAHNPYV